MRAARVPYGSARPAGARAERPPVKILVIDVDNFSYYQGLREIRAKECAMVDRLQGDPHAAGNDNRPLKPDIAKLHADFVMALAARKPVPIALEPAPEAFTDRAICCEALIDWVRLHLTALVAEAAENEPGRAIRDAELAEAINAHLGDLKSDITGTLEQVAERIREDRYDGCPRGPFYRRRGP
jgi:hypothetical protein